MSRSNNFDLIRLFAALQVVVWHSQHYLGLTTTGQLFFDVIKYFPGVPIFFVISGFLIFASFDRKKDLVQYFKNRILRIFPALWVAFFVSFAIVYSFGYRAGSFSEQLKWIFAQMTVFQNYVPAGIKAYTSHNPNPSLWTIPIEISFYVVVPVLFWIIRKTKRISMPALVVVLMVLSYGFNYYMFTIKDSEVYLFSILNDNLFPYLFYFLAGVLSYLYYDRLRPLYEGKGFYWLTAYIAYAVVAGVYLDLYKPAYFLNGIGLISVLLLSQTVIALAQTFPKASQTMLRGTDISYGVYLYHMIVISMFNKLGYYGVNAAFWPVVALTVAAALISWFLIERPSLALKSRSLHLVC